MMSYLIISYHIHTLTMQCNPSPFCSHIMLLLHNMFSFFHHGLFSGSLLPFTDSFIHSYKQYSGCIYTGSLWSEILSSQLLQSSNSSSIYLQEYQAPSEYSPLLVHPFAVASVAVWYQNPRANWIARTALSFHWSRSLSQRFPALLLMQTPFIIPHIPNFFGLGNIILTFNREHKPQWPQKSAIEYLVSKKAV